MKRSPSEEARAPGFEVGSGRPARKTKLETHGSDATRARCNRVSSFARLAEQEYKVGPGRPPKEHQFKPGQSGNPKGRKRKEPSLIPDLKDLFENAFNQKVTVTQGERQRLLTMWGAGMQQLAVQFAKGDRHARRDVFWIAERLGAESLTATKALDGVLAAERQAILDAYVAREAQLKASSASFPVMAPPELLDDAASDELEGT
jgi:Family of unknown function (DUF5681)